jgi:hypothetical protein
MTIGVNDSAKPASTQQSNDHRWLSEYDFDLVTGLTASSAAVG